MGKIIYECKGKAAEYSKYAFSAFVGCSNACTYCYLKQGRFKAILGGDKPTLKKCFKDEDHALEVFEKELKANLPELQEHGLFFSFTGDWALKECIELTMKAVDICIENQIYVKLLSKRADFIETRRLEKYKRLVAFGFSLSGHNELETNASTNSERIEAIWKLHNAGFKTFASIEPVIDFESSFKMIRDSREFCDLFKIGLLSGGKYNKDSVNQFVEDVIECTDELECKLYFKDSLLAAAGIRREDLPETCVTRDI